MRKTTIITATAAGLTAAALALSQCHHNEPAPEAKPEALPGEPTNHYAILKDTTIRTIDGKEVPNYVIAAGSCVQEVAEEPLQTRDMRWHVRVRPDKGRVQEGYIYMGDLTRQGAPERGSKCVAKLTDKISDQASAPRESIYKYFIASETMDIRLGPNEKSAPWGEIAKGSCVVWTGAEGENNYLPVSLRQNGTPGYLAVAWVKAGKLGDAPATISEANCKATFRQYTPAELNSFGYKAP